MATSGRFVQRRVAKPIDIQPAFTDRSIVLYCIYPFPQRFQKRSPPHQLTLCRSLHAGRQLEVKDLPKVPTWRLERDSNPRPSGRKASNLAKRHHAPAVEGQPSVLLSVG